MTSRFELLSLTMGCLLLASCAITEREHIEKGASPPLPPESRLDVDGEVERICRETLGYAYPSGDITYRQHPLSRTWVVATKGRHGLITSQFEVRNGSISSSVILSSKEQRGRQIRSHAFLQQFRGLSLSESGLFEKQVDGITGATISSKAVEAAALLALRLDAMIRSNKQ